MLTKKPLYKNIHSNIYKNTNSLGVHQKNGKQTTVYLFNRIYNKREYTTDTAI